MAFNNVFDQHPVVSQDNRAYLQHICHMIWVENHAGLGWSLKNFNLENIRFLTELWVDMHGWTSDGHGLNGCWGAPNPIWRNGSDPVSREWYKACPLARFLVEGSHDQAEALKALLKWEMKNFFHAYGSPSSGENWGWEHYDSEVRDWDVPLEAYFRERIIGCHGGAKILCAMLRSINIPSIEIHYNGHGIAFMPTINRYVHGDYIADMTVLPDPSLIIMTREELEQWIFSDQGYLGYYNHLFGQIPHLSIKLRRRDGNLFVAPALSAQDSPDELPQLYLPGDVAVRNQILKDLEEYRIHEIDGRYYSNLIPIQKLTDLPNYANLRVADIGLDEQNFLRMTLRNDGDYFVPSGRGTLGLSIDGKTRGGYSLPILADQSFREPEGEIYLRTNFRVKGNGRKIRVVLKDINGPCLEPLVYEEVINAPMIDGVDLTIQDIALDGENRVYFKVANLGTRDSEPGLKARVRIIVQGERAVDFDKEFDDILLANASNFQNIYPPDPIVINTQRSVWIFMNTYHALGDLDNTNNYMTKSSNP
jgi:hypothetical protein